MENPWRALPNVPPYVLGADLASINQSNAKRHWIEVENVLPEPFIGAVHSARVIALQLNPGFNAELDPPVHAQADFRTALLKNLRHEESDWPFYYFDPAFTGTPGGKWWARHTKKLREAVPVKTLAQRFAVVELFPYKSHRYRRCDVDSQSYGFELVRNAMKRDAVVLISRSLAMWESAIPELRGYGKRLTLSNYQRVYITPNNLMLRGVKSNDAWEQLISAFQ